MILLKVYQADPVGISGYDLIAELTNTFAGMWAAQSGTIYPLLSRMQEKGLIASRDMKSEIGPVKKVFNLTGISKEVIETMLVENFEPELRFFGNYLEFVCDMMIKLRKKDNGTAINLDQVKKGLELFATHLDETKLKMGNFIGTIADQLKLKCKSCNYTIEREARYCPSCGNSLT